MRNNYATRIKSQDVFQKAIACLFNKHTINSFFEASRFSKGELDIKLLKMMEIKVDEEVTHNPIVLVEAVGMTYNFAVKRTEAVFAVSTSEGRFFGRYFASAFKELSL